MKCFSALLLLLLSAAAASSDIEARMDAMEARNSRLEAHISSVEARNVRLDAEVNNFKAEVKNLRDEVAPAGSLLLFTDGRTECPSKYQKVNATTGFVFVGMPEGGKSGQHYNRALDAGEVGRSHILAHSHKVSVRDRGHSHVGMVNDPGHTHAALVKLTDPGHKHTNTVNDPGHTHAATVTDPGHTHTMRRGWIGQNTPSKSTGYDGKKGVLGQGDLLPAKTGVSVRNTASKADITVHSATAPTGLSVAVANNSSKTGIKVDALPATSNIDVTVDPAVQGQEGEGEHYPLVYVLVCEREQEKIGTRRVHSLLRGRGGAGTGSLI